MRCSTRENMACGQMHLRAISVSKMSKLRIDDSGLAQQRKRVAIAASRDLEVGEDDG